MIDYTPTLVEALKTILPTHYELKLSGSTKTPCISYQERSNAAQEQGETVGYSRISYTIKVWGNDLEQLNKYAQQIDNVLRPLGWKRTGANDLHSYQSSMIQKIMTYEALFRETFN
jgi:hypothetical protein